MRPPKVTELISCLEVGELVSHHRCLRLPPEVVEVVPFLKMQEAVVPFSEVVKVVTFPELVESGA